MIMAEAIMKQLIRKNTISDVLAFHSQGKLYHGLAQAQTPEN